MIISFDLCLGVETLKYPTQILGLRERSCFHNLVPQLNWKEEMHIEDFLYYDTKLLSQLGVRNSKSIYYKVKK
jgi:hypothetical protein